MSKKALDKRQKLLARKEELLNELKYYERRIEEARSCNSKTNCNYDVDSSDSEIEFVIDTGPSLSELRQQKARLKTCLLATQELIELTVIQSEVITLVDPPVIEDEVPITEEGTWQEVMAECRVDLVPFTISFYTHQPSRPFAATSYRGLCVMPTKLSHERELTRSVLPTLAAPSDAVEVIRSYATEHRARRTSLAQLADKYGGELFMEQSPEGGLTVRCADLLQVSWTLQNKHSPVAPFRHKMKFDLEYMDEPYVKAISQAYKALGDPKLDTDGRTLLLSKIIDTCLEAKRQMGPTDNTQTQPSDQDSDVPADTDQIMGPPKSLPKKGKRKDKENVATNDMREERNAIGNSSELNEGETDAKKANSKDEVDKSNTNKNAKNEIMSNEVRQGTAKKSAGSKHGNPKEKAVKNSKSNEELLESAKITKNSIENQKKKHLKEKDSVQTEKDTQSFTSDVAGFKNEKNNGDLKMNVDKKDAEIGSKTKDSTKKGGSKIVPTEKENSDQHKDLKSKPVVIKRKTEAVGEEIEPQVKKSKMSVANVNKKTEHTNTESNIKQDTDKNKELIKSKGNDVKQTVVTEKKVKQIQNQDKNILGEAATKTDKMKRTGKIPKENLIPEKSQQNPKNFKNIIKKTENNQVLKQNAKVSLKKTSDANSKLNIVQKSNNIPTLSERFKNKTNTDNIEKTSVNKNTNEDGIKKQSNNENLMKTTEKSNKFKIDKLNTNSLKSKLNNKNKEINQKPNLNNQKTMKLNSKLDMDHQKVRKSLGLKKIVSENILGNKVTSKIPQKMTILKRDHKNVMTNPLRMSPRMHHFKASTTCDSSKTSTGSQQRHTNIPRLLKKPTAKPN